jgi:hypothetical protein
MVFSVNLALTICHYSKLNAGYHLQPVKYKHLKVRVFRTLFGPIGNDHASIGIAANLQTQNATFLALASKTAALEAELQKIKMLYTQLRRAKSGSVNVSIILRARPRARQKDTHYDLKCVGSTVAKEKKYANYYNNCLLTYQ